MKFVHRRKSGFSDLRPVEKYVLDKIENEEDLKTWCHYLSPDQLIAMYLRSLNHTQSEIAEITGRTTKSVNLSIFGARKKAEKLIPDLVEGREKNETRGRHERY